LTKLFQLFFHKIQFSSLVFFISSLEPIFFFNSLHYIDSEYSIKFPLIFLECFKVNSNSDDSI